MDREKSPSASVEEWKLMSLLWEEPRTLMQMVEALKEEKGWAKSTVATMLSRMEKKGLIRYEERGRARLYFPAVEREAVVLKETHSFLERVYRGSVGMMLNTLLEDNHLSREEIEELHEILRKAGRE